MTVEQRLDRTPPEDFRVIRDEGYPTGWKLEVGPFPGWAEVPEW